MIDRARLSALRADEERRFRAGDSLLAGGAEAIARYDVPWHVQRLGCRAEYWFCPPPRNGADAAAAVDEDLEDPLHLWSLNLGVLLTPFHTMALFSPHHSEADVDRHTEVFGEAVAALVG